MRTCDALAAGGGVETVEYVLFCNEAGRVDIFLKTVDLLNGWLCRMGTLHPCIHVSLISAKGEDINGCGKS